MIASVVTLLQTRSDKLMKQFFIYYIHLLQSFILPTTHNKQPKQFILISFVFNGTVRS